MEREYAEQYSQLYHHHWWWRCRERVILGVLRRWHRNSTFSRTREILDVGCGDGLFFSELAQFGIPHGIESDPDLLSPDNPFADSITVGQLDDNYTPEQSFSWILMLDVLEHMDDPHAALRRASELLEPGGTILITVPAFKCLWTQHDEYNRHVTRYTRTTLNLLISDLPLQVDRMKYFFHWTFPAKLMIRFKEWLVRGKPGPARVPVAPINLACHGLTRLEQVTVGKLPLPFGSSLLATLSLSNGNDG